jgi:hypothetical protein
MYLHSNKINCSIKNYLLYSLPSFGLKVNLPKHLFKYEKNQKYVILKLKFIIQDMLNHEIKKFSTNNQEIPSDLTLAEIHSFNVTEKGKIDNALAKKGLSHIKSFFNLTSNSSSDEQKYASTIESKTSILKELDARSGTFMESDIQTFYRDTYTKSIQKSLEKRGVLEKNMGEALEQVIADIAKKYITDFKNKIKTALLDEGLSEKELAQFWQWRITNPPNSKPLLIQGKDKNYIQYDNFASKKAIEQFLLQNNSPTDDIENLYTTEELEKLEDDLGDFAQQLEK